MGSQVSLEPIWGSTGHEAHCTYHGTPIHTSDVLLEDLKKAGKYTRHKIYTEPAIQMHNTGSTSITEKIFTQAKHNATSF